MVTFRASATKCGCSLIVFLFLLLTYGTATLAAAQSKNAVPPDRCAGQEDASGDCRVAGSVLRSDVDLVLVPVNVTDALNTPVVGLLKNSFAFFDQAREEPIRYFSSEDAPLSVGLILDVSNSMANKIGAEREALGQFFNHANPEDEYFAIAVTDRPKIIAESDETVADIQGKLTFINPSGYTALLDAIHLAADRLHSARNRRRVILIISDGGDNVSRYRPQQIESFLREEDVLVYAIRPCDAIPMFKTIEEKLGNKLLTRLTDATGGRAISVSDPQRIPEVAAAISTELRNQYVLGYSPPKVDRDGKWHKITVRLSGSALPQSSVPYKVPLHVSYRKGYTAPTS